MAPNAHNIGLLAIQTSTPRNADCVLPPLKTPATDFNPYFQGSTVDEHAQVWDYHRNETEGNQHLESQPNQCTPQLHAWPGSNDEQNYVHDDTVRQVDLDRDDDDKTQYCYVNHEGREHSANAEEYGVDMQLKHIVEYNGQIAVDKGHSAHSSCPAPMEHEDRNHLFTYAQPQQSEYGQMFPEHQWNQQMYELEPQDVTDVAQLQAADDRHCYYDNVQINCPYSDSYRAVNIAGQPQWSAAPTFPHIVSNAAQSGTSSVVSSAVFQNDMTSTWPRTNVTAAPSREMPGRSSTKLASHGDGNFGGYRVQYRQPRRDQFHTVSAAGDGCQTMTAEQADTPTAATMTASERLQQAFLHSGKQSALITFSSIITDHILHLLYK